MHFLCAAAALQCRCGHLLGHPARQSVVALHHFERPEPLAGPSEARCVNM